MKHAHYSYTVGGSLAVDDPTYVRRPADDVLYQAIEQGYFCYVLGPRQTGKSSLRIKTRHRLEQSGCRCATVQVTEMSLAAASWDKQLISLIWDSLYPTEAIALSKWLEATATLSTQRRLEHFTRDLLFPELLLQPLVIFIDEIDYLLEVPEAIRNLLIWIEKCYSLRDKHGEYQPLSFVLLGATTVSALVDKATIPLDEHSCDVDLIAGNAAIERLFSVVEQLARHIPLSSFKLHSLRPLQPGFASRFSSPVAALKVILSWTNGQPFLTQKLCQIVTTRAQLLSAAAVKKISATPAKLSRWIGQVVYSSLIDNWATADDPVHLRAIRDRLHHSPHHLALLQLYKRVSAGMSIKCSGNSLQSELLSIGLVCCDRQHIRPANKIYQQTVVSSSLKRPLQISAQGHSLPAKRSAASASQ
ncbi:MAG: AAA-like domain-containing protein [Phormidesmis sp.]